MRLRDLLATLESAALLGAAETRLRGLGEQLQFACLALPCSEALVALEVAHLGRLEVPGVATAESWRAAELQFLASGTPFAYLLGGGGGYGAELDEADPMLAALRPALETVPRQALFVPIRVGGGVVGGAALFRDAELHRALGPEGAERALVMAERLAEVLALTVESYRTERVLLQLFAQALPELCAADATTGFGAALEDYLHQLRIAPAYRRRLELAEVIGRVAAKGEAESRLVGDLLARIGEYVAELTMAAPELDLGELDDGEPAP